MGCLFCRQRGKRKVALSAQAEGKELSSPSLSKGTKPLLTNFYRSIPSYPFSKSDFGKASTYFEEATGNFDPSRELGEGGFGTIYYGVLQDGRVVAAKRLFENNFKRVEQFMNEVEILTRLRHDNLELNSSKQAVDTNRDRHDIKLANMAINKIQNHTLNELVDQSLGFDSNSVVRRRITLVAELAFRCLQMERDMRPSMEEILKTLRGIKDDESNTLGEVVEILVDGDVGISKENPPPMSPDSASTEKWVSNSSLPNISG